MYYTSVTSSESKITLYVRFKYFNLLKTGTVLLEKDVLLRTRSLYAKLKPPLILHGACADLVPQTFSSFWTCPVISEEGKLYV